jgi:hypothetical protein
MDEERVDGTREGVALWEALLNLELLRSLILRRKDSRLSNLFARLCAVNSKDVRRLDVDRRGESSASWTVYT